MNTLAHLYLSGDDPALLLGNFIGDSVRGTEFAQLETSVQAGVIMHREIDRYTDSHPVVKALCQLMRNDFGRYATVVADVFMDHFLARDWSRFHHQSLERYTDWVHRTLDPQLKNCPDRSQRYFDYLRSTDTLLHYRSKEGIARTLAQMAQRTRFGSGMENAGQVLDRLYQDLEDGFEVFFPDLMKFAASR